LQEKPSDATNGCFGTINQIGGNFSADFKNIVKDQGIDFIILQLRVR
jgi:hypothetical protein